MAKKKYTEEQLMLMAIDEMKKSVPDVNRKDEKVNPKVGAVLASPAGELLGKSHRGELRDGDHAEFTLLERKSRAQNLTGMVLYATLEPCSPGARNHPKLSCAERIFNARLGKVFIGCIDPDPTVAGEGRDFLKTNGIEVDYFPKHLQDLIYNEDKNFFDDAEIRADRHKEKQIQQPSKPLEVIQENYNLGSLSEEAQNELINRMSLPYSVGSPQWHKFISELHLIEKTQRNQSYKPTGLGLLLLGKNPQSHYPQNRIKFTIEHEGSKALIPDIEGPILLMPKRIEEVLDASFITEINRKDFHRVELAQISKTLLRELIVNAIVHRDYLIEGAQIKVLACADRIEIWSPGKPLFEMEEFQRFDVPSQSTNPKIAYLFFKSKLVEERNIGMKELKKYVERYKTAPPSFEMKGQYFVITVYRQHNQSHQLNLTEKESDNPLFKRLTTPQIKLYRYIDNHGPVSSSEYAKIIDKSDRTVRNYFKGMEKILKKTGSGPSTRYEIMRKED